MRLPVFPVAFALSLSWASLNGYAALPTNTVNEGQIIHGGTYANTANDLTTFKNSQGTGLWLQSGSTIRGVEVNSQGALTNNGGHIYLDAPNQVVRLDGNVDVRGVQDSNGLFQGNGGRVIVDAAYLYQTGNIYASGTNGGMVQINVGSMTMGPTAHILALGYNGQGGVVSVNSSGSADLQQGSVINTSGKVTGNYETNVISVEGSLVNMQGNLIADGIQSRGGIIRLVSTGQTDLTQTDRTIQAAATNGIFSTTESSAIQNQLASLKTQLEGSINIGPVSTNTSGINGVIETQGASGNFAPNTLGNDQADPTARGAGDGGTIIVTAQNAVHNSGWLLADAGNSTANNKGGNGGTVSLNAGSSINNSGRLEADGGHGASGGDGGLIALSYPTMANPGVIRASGSQGTDGSGGNGGLTVFNSLNNPTGSGVVTNFAGLSSTASNHGQSGSIVIPNALTATNTLVGIWRKTQPVEVLVHGENIIMLQSKTSVNLNTLWSYIQSGRIRSTRDQVGEAGLSATGPATAEILDKYNGPSGNLLSNFTFSQRTPDTTTLDFSMLNKQVNLIQPVFPFTQMTILSAGPIVANAQPYLGGILGGTNGYFSSISPAFSGGIMMNSFNTANVDIATTAASSTFLLNNIVGGSLIIKSLSDIYNDGYAMGSNVQMISQGKLTNGITQGFGLDFDDYKMGGNIYLKGLTGFTSMGDNTSIFSNTGPPYSNGTQYGGDILIQSQGPIVTTGANINAYGSVESGKITIEPLP